MIFLINKTASKFAPRLQHAALILFCLLSTQIVHAANGEHQAIAEVNGVRFYYSDIDREIYRQLKLRPEELSRGERHEVRRSVLYRIIERQLLLQAAREHGHVAAENDIHALLAETQSSFESSKAFLQQLSALELDEKSFADGLRDDLSIQDFLQQVVFRDIQIQDADIIAVYDRDKEKYTSQEEVKARNIFIKFPSTESTKESEALLRVAEIRELLSKPKADFQQLARKYSEAPNASSGGDLGYFTRNQMPEEFSARVFALSSGQISEPIQTPNGIHLVLLEEKRGGEVPPLDKVRETIRSNLLKEAQQKALDSYLRTLRQKGKVILYLD